MSIEITFHPETSDKQDLRALLLELGFEPWKHLRNWPEGSLHFRWFNDVAYQSYDGVEATIFSPTEALKEGFPPCAWALHTRTRVWASPADRKQQNHVVRTARARFGGGFYNDSTGKNRYTKIEDDGRDAPSRGIYLTYESVRESISAVQFPCPTRHRNSNGTLAPTWSPFPKATHAGSSTTPSCRLRWPLSNTS